MRISRLAVPVATLFAMSCAHQEPLVTPKPAPTKEYSVIVEKDIWVPMRDGVRLSANVFRPDSPEKFPVLLVRTPYGKDNDERRDTGMSWAKRGYVVVFQDTRGRGKSEGKFRPFLDEANDGYDTQEWAGVQPWSNGKVGTMDGSYMGFVQWLPAPLGSKHLTAMFPIVGPADLYHDITHHGGAFRLLNMMWGSRNGAPPGVDPDKIDWQRAYRHLPLSTWDDAVGYRIDFLREWIAHPTYDEYWKPASIRGNYKNITVPVFSLGGWYDVFCKATLTHFNGVLHNSKSQWARKHQHLMIGPYTHDGPWSAHSQMKDGRVGELDFGPQALIDGQEIERQWFDYWLKGIPNEVVNFPRIRIFVMGENVWRNENEWPLKRTCFTKYFLRSAGRANTADGDGTLSSNAPETERADTFIYDPDNPVPTVGGNDGPFNQQEVEKRDDVLVYSTPKLSRPVEVTGPITVILYAASSAPDTDFTAKLVDVHPDGKAYNLCEGIIRARYRESDTQPSLITSGEIYKYEIDLWATSNLFKEGHQIRVEISSSNFPRFDRNPNTGHDFGADAELRKANQTIYHDAKHPSHIVLPVIPR